MSHLTSNLCHHMGTICEMGGNGWGWGRLARAPLEIW